jgi:antitoxin VapB
MPFHIRDPETDRLARQLARVKGIGLTEAVKLALGNELKRATTVPPEEFERRMAAIRELQAKVAAMPETGLKADKAFFDELSGDDDDR